VTGDDPTIADVPMTGDGEMTARGLATVTAATSVEGAKVASASARTIVVAITDVPTGRRGIRAAGGRSGHRNRPKQATQPLPATRRRPREPRLFALPVGIPRGSAVTMPAAGITIDAEMTVAPTDATSGGHASRNRLPARKPDGKIVGTVTRK
jgi:hypothetical protein